MPEKPLVIDNLSMGYGGASRVLDGVSLILESSDALALVGVNGAGKTSLIKSLLDFIDIDDGSIEIFGCSHSKYQARTGLAYLPEKFRPPYYLTGRDFLYSMSQLYQSRYDENEILKTMQILDLPEQALSHSVREYSKGMSQKLGLIACLHSERRLLIMDEPMSGLDPKARHAFKTILKDLHMQGRTLLFSTHVLADISTICNKMAILHNGCIRFYGTPEDCCRQYGVEDLESAYLACIST